MPREVNRKHVPMGGDPTAQDGTQSTAEILLLKPVIHIELKLAPYRSS